MEHELDIFATFQNVLILFRYWYFLHFLQISETKWCLFVFGWNGVSYGLKWLLGDVRGTALWMFGVSYGLEWLQNSEVWVLYCTRPGRYVDLAVSLHRILNSTNSQTQYRFTSWLLLQGSISGIYCMYFMSVEVSRVQSWYVYFKKHCFLNIFVKCNLVWTWWKAIRNRYWLEWWD